MLIRKLKYHFHEKQWHEYSKTLEILGLERFKTLRIVLEDQEWHKEMVSIYKQTRIKTEMCTMLLSLYSIAAQQKNFILDNFYRANNMLKKILLILNFTILLAIANATAHGVIIHEVINLTNEDIVLKRSHCGDDYLNVVDPGRMINTRTGYKLSKDDIESIYLEFLFGLPIKHDDLEYYCYGFIPKEMRVLFDGLFLPHDCSYNTACCNIKNQNIIHCCQFGAHSDGLENILFDIQYKHSHIHINQPLLSSCIRINPYRRQVMIISKVNDVFNIIFLPIQES